MSNDPSQPHRRPSPPTASASSAPTNDRANLVRRTLRSTFLSLRTRNFRLFFIGQTISNTGNWLTNVALTLLVLKLTDSGIGVGLLAACQYGPIFILSAWAGAIADRFDKRKLLFLTQSLEMTQSISLAIVAFMPHPPLGLLYGLAVFGGVLLSFDNPLRRSFVTEMVPRDDIPNAVVLYSIIINVSRIFGPALAGLLVVTVGYGWCFTLDATSYLAVLICLFLMRPEELWRPAKRPRVKGAVREGFRYVQSMPILWIPFVMLAAVSTLAYNFNVTLPLFVTDALNGSDGDFTLLIPSSAREPSPAHLSSPIERWSRSGTSSEDLLFSAPACSSSRSCPMLAAFPAAFLVGVAGILYMTSTTSIIQVEARRDMHGRVLALQTVIIGGSAAFGGPLLGWMADTVGARALMVVGGVVCVGATVFGRVASKSAAQDNAAISETESAVGTTAD